MKLTEHSQQSQQTPLLPFKWHILLLVLSMLINPTTIHAYSTRVGDIEYYTDYLDRTAKVYGLYYMSNPVRLSIPETITINEIEYKVTEIMSEAFKDKNFEECILPESIIKIGEGAFMNCKNLSAISIPSKVERIENKTFYECKSLATINLPEKLYYIGDYAFKSCLKLKDLELPDRVYTIGISAFQSCISLGAVKFPSNIGELRMSAFEYSGITIADFTGCNRISDIPYSAFGSCLSLEVVKLPQNLTHLGHSAFACDEKIKTIILPPYMKEIENNSAFDGCKLIKAAYPSTLKDNPFGRGYGNGGVSIQYPAEAVIPKDGCIYNRNMTILYYAPIDISSYQCPNSLRTISSNTFENCEILESIDIPITVNTIGKDAFYNCPSLSSFTIQDGESSLEIDTRIFSSQKFKSFYLGRNCTNNTFNNIDIETLELGATLTDGKALNCKKYTSLLRIVSNAVNPPLMNPFTEEQYAKVDVVIPENSLANYCSDNIWKPFFHVAADGISFSNSKYEVQLNRELQLEPIITPAYATEVNFEWTSSNNDIASVDSKGIVKANRIGTCTITVKSASDENVTASCEINVTPVYVTSFEITPTEWRGKVGEKFEIIVTSMMPEDATNKTVTYSSSNDNIVRLDEDGYFSTLRAGEATITVCANGSLGCYVECKVTVDPAPCTAIEIQPWSKTCVIGQSFDISANVLPQYASNKTLAWTSSDEEIAIVDNKGHVTAKNIGTCIITASTTDGSDISATCTVTVLPILVKSIALDCTEWTGFKGESFHIRATVLPDNATDNTIVWSSSDESVAIVNSDGLVTATGVGECVITATASDGSEISATCSVIVKPVLVQLISLDYAEWTGVRGESFQIKATVLPDNATDPTVVWSSSDAAVATVDSDGTVTAAGVGEAVITVTAADGSEVSATCRVTVNPVLVESISLDPDAWSGVEGDKFSIKAIVMPEDADNKTLEWSSDDESVATVDSKGVVSVVKEGTCTIVAKSTDGSDRSAECLVTSISGIDDIFADDEAVFDIYNLQGTFIRTKATRDDLKKLSSGIYIIYQDGSARKIIIR